MEKFKEFDSTKGFWTKELKELVLKGDVKTAEEAIKNGADVNAVYNNGDSLLMKASELGHKEIVELLLKYNVNIEYQNAEGWNALMRAAEANNAEIIKKLLAKGADSNKQNKFGWTALIVAADYNNKEAVEALLEDKRINVNIRDNRGLTALAHASRKNNLEIVEIISKAEKLNVFINMPAPLIAQHWSKEQVVEYFREDPKFGKFLRNQRKQKEE